MPKIWTVAELTGEISLTLAQNSDLRNCWVSGELSNFKHHRPSGHWYFTLKDETACLKGVMFRLKAEKVPFVPSDGMRVLVRGNVRLYERDGTLQLYAEEMEPAGLGELYLAFEQLKKRLAEEGLFDQSRKKTIPRYPRKVGIVTSPTGAALRDILHIMGRRYPTMSWVLAPAAVQGEGAPAEIARAIARMNRYDGVDVLIVGRGGGSLEELWAFNTEVVARAIAASRIPVIAAVGHETDVTIADYAADLRAPTPSAAAELAVPLLSDLQDSLYRAKDRLKKGMSRQLEDKARILNRLALSKPLQDPFWRIEQERQKLDKLASGLENAMTRFVADKNGILQILAAKLDLLSPLAVLGRGYALAYDYNNENTLIRSVDHVQINDLIKVHLADGRLKCRVMDKEKNND